MPTSAIAEMIAIAIAVDSGISVSLSPPRADVRTLTRKAKAKRSLSRSHVVPRGRDSVQAETSA
jgi:hypothetical protein